MKLPCHIDSPINNRNSIIRSAAHFVSVFAGDNLSDWISMFSVHFFLFLFSFIVFNGYGVVRIGKWGVRWTSKRSQFF